MSRFDEFRESLENASEYLNQAISCLNADDFESEDARYFEVHEHLADADSALDEARQDLSDAVGIVANAELLSEVVESLNALMGRTWTRAVNCLDGEERDWLFKWDCSRIVRKLQYEIDQIIHDAR